ncbi:iron permease [Burkholderia pseudomallei]|uniref:Iron permease FTR1 family protein n=1 Tax=Burkholderia pseudomallei TaxID=28450 RepID=A0A2K9CZU2_BURPE|nr:FTR1 family protein [Burkholderia pseudomallei]KGW44413.1 iron permease FTR1 family protein [Burkholderia pseudomallei MSHR684]KGX75778.1 iron permease FTR1 family protein [Burkholderia pseudomallei MSHR435]AGR70135.1 iron permease FTR1 family protein [Burkholderia pseudomallei MSHR305]AHE31706.1 iron permease FTR1 family protein [Burkholderia pseudomallei NCTC 13178]AHE37657.1 iron permease FTR1 family protein [Burkholderia pseudomallei NAU20B-16]
MLSTAVIVFREVLEAALVVSIVLAATKGVPGRAWWVSAGLLGGVVGAAFIAAFADVVSAWASGMGQEVFNAGVMFVATIMLAWHSIWMGKHGREMAQQLSQVGRAVAAGSRPLTGLAIVVGVAVLREGSEAVLFLYGIAAGDPGQAPQMIAGGALGVLGGVGLGAGMYAGLLQIPLQRLFSVTNALIVLLAAGMASQGTGFLVSAGWLPSWGDTVWDTSWLLKESSVVGKMLHTLVGYTARPAGIQIVAYVATLLVIVLLARRVARKQAIVARPTRAA